MNNLGTIFYNYDAIDITVHINSTLFNDSEYLNSGVESLVYDKGDYVYKVKKDGYISDEDLEKQKQHIINKNKIEIFLEEEIVGYLTHLLEPSVKHLVTKQKKVSVQKDCTEIVLQLVKNNWIPTVSQYEKDNYVIYDIRPDNCGIDENGNFKIIDCVSYTK